jgi:hypothetical protein
MANKTWYDHFLEVLAEKYPKKVHLTQALMDLLCIEREAVYRRLRKDVSFSVHEIVKIAAAWNLSLDRIGSINSGVIPFQMTPMNFLNPSEQEIQSVQAVIDSINDLKNSPDAEFMDVCNKLPRQFVTGFNYLSQFSLFKWRYQYGCETETTPFGQIQVSDEKRLLTIDYHRAIKRVPTSSFILDHKIFENLISDIKFFCSIRMITEDEKELIKKDLYNLLDYLLEVANRGCYPETQNKVNLYISHLNIDTNYSYVHTPSAKICFVHALGKYEIQSYDSEMVANFKTWMQLKKRTSMQISEVDEKSRIEFFTKQQKMLAEW